MCVVFYDCVLEFSHGIWRLLVTLVEGVGRERELCSSFVMLTKVSLIFFFSLKLEIETLEISFQYVSQCF